MVSTRWRTNTRYPFSPPVLSDSRRCVQFLWMQTAADPLGVVLHWENTTLESPPTATTRCRCCWLVAERWPPAVTCGGLVRRHAWVFAQRLCCQKLARPLMTHVISFNVRTMNLYASAPFTSLLLVNSTLQSTKEKERSKKEEESSPLVVSCVTLFFLSSSPSQRLFLQLVSWLGKSWQSWRERVKVRKSFEEEKSSKDPKLSEREEALRRVCLRLQTCRMHCRLGVSDNINIHPINICVLIQNNIMRSAVCYFCGDLRSGDQCAGVSWTLGDPFVLQWRKVTFLHLKDIYF